MNKIAKYLNQQIVGNVFDQELIREKFSTDRSILKIVPDFVVMPENTYDIRKIVRFVNQIAEKDIRIPITMRGGGNSKTGACLGAGIVISTQKLNKVQEIDVRGRLVRVQAGVTLGQLNTALAIQGLCLPIDAHPSETIGGLIAGYPCDNFAYKYGGIGYFVDQLEFIATNGDFCQTGRLSEKTILEGKNLSMFERRIYDNIKNIIIKYNGTLTNLPENRSVMANDISGYQTVSRVYQNINGSIDLLPLMFGSEGTLGIITEVILRCELLPITKTRIAIDLKNLQHADDVLGRLEKLRPLRIDVYEKKLFENLNLAQAKIENNLLRLGEGEFLAIAELDDRGFWAQPLKLRKARELLQDADYLISDNENGAEFDWIEHKLITFLNLRKTGEKIAGCDNIYIPKKMLLQTVDKIQELGNSLEIEMPFYGSFTNETWTFCPEFNLQKVEEKKKMLLVLKKSADLVRDLSGSMTGKCAEGRVKGLLAINRNNPAEQAFFKEIKQTFDPNYILNPNLKTGLEIREIIQHLRTAGLGNIITK